MTEDQASSNKHKCEGDSSISKIQGKCDPKQVLAIPQLHQAHPELTVPANQQESNLM